MLGIPFIGRWVSRKFDCAGRSSPAQSVRSRIVIVSEPKHEDDQLLPNPLLLRAPR